jgi:AbrB family looped-hinge helix DNA binding protein
LLSVILVAADVFSDDLTGKARPFLEIAPMADAATTKLSSKGQVVIPEEVRNRMGLKAGAQFVVLGDRDVVILKVIQPPSMSEFEPIVKQARRAAKQSGMKRKDLARAVKEARTRR